MNPENAILEYFKEFEDEIIYGYMDVFKLCFNHFYHFSFLISCNENNVVPNGLRLKHEPSIASGGESFYQDWQATISNAENNLLDILIAEQKRLFVETQIKFWKFLHVSMSKCQNKDTFLNWWFKLCMYREKYARKLRAKKLKKLRKLTGKVNVFLSTEGCSFSEDLEFLRKAKPSRRSEPCGYTAYAK